MTCSKILLPGSFSEGTQCKTEWGSQGIFSWVKAWRWWRSKPWHNLGEEHSSQKKKKTQQEHRLETVGVPGLFKVHWESQNVEKGEVRGNEGPAHVGPHRSRKNVRFWSEWDEKKFWLILSRRGTLSDWHFKKNHSGGLVVTRMEKRDGSGGRYNNLGGYWWVFELEWE